jgi:hypothetical protein
LESAGQTVKETQIHPIGKWVVFPGCGRDSMAGGLTFGSQRLGRRFFTRFDRNQARLGLGEVLDYPLFGMLLAGG